MSRWSRGWPGALKARAARYALQRWIGPFLQEPLRLEQLGLDLGGGTGTLRGLRLRAQAVDELLLGAGAPLELLEGRVGAVTVAVPWAALGTEPVTLRVTELRLLLRPRQEGGRAWLSPGVGAGLDSRSPLRGLEALALTIESVLRRLRVVLEGRS
ncbi:autophagy-related protein 2 homolog A-like [Myiozetetes cayanensis]|uniref:autophagy-related protein 2 homolog A-like n=1 Tax=Myiozetetes cayanensis TaxID=478635 RepID=UPI00215F46FA|nr:autophagy-related protein 2 homolog A-like [Myiozetetes cayanensis]